MKTKFVAVMVLCFIFGGYFILNYSSLVYMSYSRPQADAVMRDFSNISNVTNGFNSSEMRRPQFERMVAQENIIYLLGGVMFIVAGIAIWYLIREEEISEITEEMMDVFLLPEEKAIVDELKKAGGEITQSDLVRRTGLSKVKIHRILGRLEGKKVIKRYPYGLTKKVVIEMRKKKGQSAFLK